MNGDTDAQDDFTCQRLLCAGEGLGLIPGLPPFYHELSVIPLGSLGNLIIVDILSYGRRPF